MQVIEFLLQRDDGDMKSLLNATCVVGQEAEERAARK